MKKLLKVGCLGFCLLLALGIIIGMFSGGGSDSTKPSTNVPQAEKKPQVKEDPINQANFDKIVQGDTLSGAGGMSSEEVIAILGKPDSTSQSKSGDVTMDSYTWTGKDFQIITVTFTNGKVSSKTLMK